MPDRMPEYMSDRVPDRMPDIMSEYMSDRMPWYMPNRMSDRMSEYMSDRMPERMSDRMSACRKYMFKYTSWHGMVGITRSKVIGTVIWVSSKHLRHKGLRRQTTYKWLFFVAIVLSLRPQVQRSMLIAQATQTAFRQHCCSPVLMNAACLSRMKQTKRRSWRMVRRWLTWCVTGIFVKLHNVQLKGFETQQKAIAA